MVWAGRRAVEVFLRLSCRARTRRRGRGEPPLPLLLLLLPLPCPPPPRALLPARPLLPTPLPLLLLHPPPLQPLLPFLLLLPPLRPLRQPRSSLTLRSHRRLACPVAHRARHDSNDCAPACCLISSMLPPSLNAMTSPLLDAGCCTSGGGRHCPARRHLCRRERAACRSRCC